MKSLFIISALLLSASPAFAAEFVYLNCESNLFITIKGLKPNQITKKEESTVIQHLKIDLPNSRIMGSINGE